MDDLKLVVMIAGQRVALPAGSIESVVEIEAITAVPLAARHVAGLAALRSRVLTIIDSYAALEIGTAPRDGLQQAVVVTVDNHLYGLLVDEVEDVVQIAGDPAPLHAGLARGWMRAALGLVEHQDHALLLLDPALIVAGPPTAGISVAA
jgi:purine-binding chemotaxis protein CheW